MIRFAQVALLAAFLAVILTVVRFRMAYDAMMPATKVQRTGSRAGQMSNVVESSASPRLPHSSPRRSQCDVATSCVGCALIHDKACSWCATTAVCTTDSSPCEDREKAVCSSVLTHRIPNPHRVIYVGKRTGGPEALVQLHLALLHWGFNSTMETRQKQVGKKMLPFWQNVYEKEFNAAKGRHRMNWHRDYNAFLESAKPGDRLLLTETWPCKDGILFWKDKRARQMQYHLTVQDRKLTYDVSHMYIKKANPEHCGVFSHTDFLANGFLNTSRKAVIPPYMSPNIVATAKQHLANDANRRKKRTTIVYDGDAGLNPRDFPSELRPHLRKAASIKPDTLYRLFGEALAVVDFAMPGAERLVLEGSLFGAAVVVNDELNGVSTVDFPLPDDKYRVKGRNFVQLGDALRRLQAEDPIAVVEQFSDFRSYVEGLRVQFHRSVRRYFSDTAHFVLDGCSGQTSHKMDLLGLQLLSILLHLPFAVITVRLPGTGETFSSIPSSELKTLRAFLDRHYFTAHVHFQTCDKPAAIEELLAETEEGFVALGDAVGGSFVTSQEFIAAVAVQCSILNGCPVTIGGFVVGTRLEPRTSLVDGSKDWIQDAHSSRLASGNQEDVQSSEFIQGHLVWKEFDSLFGDKSSR